MIPRLDELLDRIAEEPLNKRKSRNEIEFFEKMGLLRRMDREAYIRYTIIYNEIVNSKCDTE